MKNKIYYNIKTDDKEFKCVTLTELIKNVKKMGKLGKKYDISTCEKVKKPMSDKRKEQITKFKEASEKAKKMVAQELPENRKGAYKKFMATLLKKNIIPQINTEEKL